MFNLLFVHGFGGKADKPDFYRQAENFRKKHDLRCTIKVFSWDSKKISLFNAGSKFSAALDEAQKMYDPFKTEIDDLKKQKKSFYLVAHSLGCFIINNFLNKCDDSSRWCKGIIYLGAADDFKREVYNTYLGDEQKIINYYSPKDDRVLGQLFVEKENTDAGGHVGFKSDCFKNFRCSATHMRKGKGIHSDWSQMVSPILELLAYNHGKPIAGKENLNWVLSVGKGEDWWNNIIQLDNYDYDDKKCSIWIQHHKFEGHYRLSVAAQGSERRKRMGWSKRLAPLLKKIGLGVDHVGWPLKQI